MNNNPMSEYIEMMCSLFLYSICEKRITNKAKDQRAYPQRIGSFSFLNPRPYLAKIAI